MTLCETCDTLEISHDKGEQLLGTWDDLLDRSATGCEGCNFFTTILRISDHWSHRLEDLRDRVVFLDSLRLDCRKSDRLGVHTYSADDLLFDICGRESGEGMSEPGMCESKSDKEIVESPAIDSHRPVAVSSRDERCIDQIKSWIQECLHHENCTYFGKVPVPTRVIKVPKDSKQVPKLVVTSSQDYGEYVALSHTSDPKSETSKLTTLDLQQFQQGMDLTCLSQNFLDAIEITRRLGFEYIWIDALCTIQDDEDDRNKEASKVAKTYGLAALTISATAATDSHSGIFSDRHVHYSPMLGRNKDLCLRLNLLRWNWDIEHSPLETHGWAAQARMLSPRVLHFTKRQVVWECASEWYYEASGVPDKQYGSGQIDHSYRKVVFQPIVNDTLKRMLQLPGTEEVKAEASSPSTDSPNTSDTKNNPTNSAKRLKSWLQNISEYSGRSLPLPSDKLSAVAGIATITDNGTMGVYLAGIWSKNIEFGLSWARQLSLLTRPAEYRAPSWSWASLDGKISYDMPACLSRSSKEPVRRLRWVEDHRPTLVEHHMILRFPGQPYMGVQKGSYIVLEGHCITFDQLIQSAGEDQDKFFRATTVLDSSPIFDCPCCGPDKQGGEHIDNPSDIADLLMVLHGENWDDWRGHVDLLMLRTSRDDPMAFERSGLVRLSRRDCHGENEPADFARALDGLGFQRRVMKLF